MKKNLLTLFIIASLSTTYTFANFNKIAKNTQIILADSVDLNDYVGKFKLAEGSPVEFVSFSVKEGKLVAQAGEYPDAILAVKLKDVFEDAGMGGIFTFMRMEGKVTKLKIEIQGMELLAEKAADDKK